MGREDINHTINTLSSAVGVKSSEYQVTGFSNSNSAGYGLQIAHLSYQDNIWVLAQSRAKSGTKGVSIVVNFSLHNDRFIRFVGVLNWILNGNNMGWSLHVNFVHQGG